MTRVECTLDRALALELGHSNTATQVIGRVVGGPFGSKHGKDSRDMTDMASSLDSDVLYTWRDAASTKVADQHHPTATKTTDEWLYEINQLTSIDPMLVAVNNAMIDFVRELKGSGRTRSIAVSLTKSSTDVEAQASHARQELHNAVNRVAEMSMPVDPVNFTNASSTSWGRIALEYARLIADGHPCEYEV
eukprot:GILJ01022844.1.p1 GENE.GILJ01022844.1~~GILJ01022844.1.p1  ORF type:complete len:208 (-),score=13.90 GILJ01022844.1:491-1063(-)